ncbi:MAG TPA: glycosyltransferase family 2 protein [Thermoanaerobaculia bacterium]|nr:glycosyltransferase family 2 protein [Thermoanaerobaculia bacterium]
MAERVVLSGVVVHWGRVEPLEDLVAAWPDERRFELVVVDNGGHRASLSRPVLDRVRLVDPGANLGFGGGANAGSAVAQGDWLLFLNPDVVPEPGAVAQLVEGLSTHGAAGGVPRLVGPGGEGQEGWQLRGRPRRRHLMLQALQVPAAPRQEGAGPGEAIEQPAAAALALRREVFTEIGGFDARFHPAWFEDVDLAARLAAAGHRVVYHPAAVFRHRQGDSVGQLGYGRFLWIFQRNLVRYVDKHHPGWAALAVRMLLPAGLAARACLLPLRRPRRAASRSAALAGLAAALAGALSGWRLPRGWAETAAAGCAEGRG